jgi:hypothetical protein
VSLMYTANPTAKAVPVLYTAIKTVTRMPGQGFKTPVCRTKEILNTIKEAPVEYPTITVELLRVQVPIYNTIGISKVYISVKTRNSC